MANILVIDDDLATLSLLRRWLTMDGYEFSLAMNGEDGLIAFQTEKPELVFTDMFMPDMNGEKVIQRIRAMDTDCPIIACSGGGLMMGTDILANALASGANFTLTKPFSHRDLTKVLNQVFGKTSTKREQ
ncbi:MAG: response regulator [Magnetococcales bacterium]|nr:response regulator [Magnetococcales bacterium]